jgi:hypothetical protein
MIGRIITQAGLENSHISEDAMIKFFETYWIPREEESIEISRLYSMCQFRLDNVRLIGCNASYSDQTILQGNKAYRASREVFL